MDRGLKRELLERKIGRTVRLNFHSLLLLAAFCPPPQTAPTASNLRLSCSGVGTPAVILEAGAGRGASDWARVQPAISDSTRVCSYDRNPDHCCDKTVDDLRSLLRESSVSGPYVLTGHSLGGLYVRRFAARFPGDVAGLVLIDSSDEKQLTGIIAPGLAPELYRPGAMSDSEIHAFFSNLGQRMRAAGTAPASVGKSAGADPGEIRMAAFYRQIGAERRDFMFDEKPLIVLAASQSPSMPRFTAEQRALLEEDHRTLQARMRILSRNSKQVVLPDSGHYIQLDRPDAVIAAIREVVTAVRGGGKLRPE